MYVCVRSKKHRNLILLENPFTVVLIHGEHRYECGSVSEHFQGGHVTPVHFRGEKNIENYFSLKTRFQWFLGTGNTDISVDQFQATPRGDL